MLEKKTKAILDIENKMQTLEPQSLRYQVLEAARNFKGSWVKLGQFLYTVYKDKHFKNWGFLSFEAYCKKEIGIQKNTAVKLLSSYYFLEKNEPELLKSDYFDKESSPAEIPGYEAINVLRLAKNNKNLTADDYHDFKDSLFQQGKDYKEVRREIGLRLLSAREEANPEQAREKRRQATIKRLCATLKSLQEEISVNKLLPQKLITDIENLIEKLQSEL